MISDTRSLIRRVLSGCAVDPPHGFEWFGEWIPAAWPSEDEHPTRNFLRTLALHLYFHVFCPGEATARLSFVPASGAGEVRALQTAHSFANPDRERWEPGWTYAGRSGDSYLVRRDGLEFSVSVAGVRTRNGTALCVGGNVEVLVPADRWSWSPGYMLFYGSTLLPPRSAEVRRTRLYLNLDEEGARRIIGMCGRFNDARLPFTLKVAGEPTMYDRCDTVILFVGRDDYQLASELLVEETTVSDLTARLPVPAFTRRLTPGVAVADDPHGAESFGEARCRLLATGILRAHEEGQSAMESRLREIEKAFRAEGVALDCPHLEPGSAEYEDYPWVHWLL